MAAVRMLPFRQLPLLIPPTCWSFSQRNLVTERTLLKKLGYPEKPKRPITGYLQFMNNQKAAVMAQNPGASAKVITKILSEQWKGLPEKEKQKYSEDFKKKFLVYKEQMAEYNSKITPEQKEEIKILLAGYSASEKEKALISEVKKLEKKLNKPRSPVSPFIMFCSDKHGLYQDEAVGDNRLKFYSKMWKTITTDEKKKYKDKFNEEFQKYKKELEKWEEEMMQQGNVDVIRLKTLKAKMKN